MTTPTRGDQRLTFLALNVSDLAASLEFYRNVLGIPLVEESHDADLNDPWYGGQHAAFSWKDGAFIHFAIYPAREPERPVTASAQLGFHVSEFDEVHASVQRAGAIAVQAPRDEPWGRTSRYLDPDGNIVSITEL
jgi:catechol 2,3-dioxygenase-like lactoylglutathione lyase family enzyme